MTRQAVYEACPIKQVRSTKAQVRSPLGALRHHRGTATDDGSASLLPGHRPGLVEKSEAGYTKVQTDLVQMRRDGELPYGWLADNTRWQRKPTTFNSVEQALDDTARFYRKALWADADAYVEIWLEKDALAGVVLPVTSAIRRAADGRPRLRQPVVPA